MASNPQDLEKGFGGTINTNPPCTPEVATAAPSESQRDISPDETTPSDATKSPLSDFRFAVGIHNAPDLSDSDRRPAANRGIYKSVVKAEKAASRQYKMFAILINGALGLQIIFASALTALGASGAQKGSTGKNNAQAVTAFGAMNTVLAGFLTFLKGSGLPNRQKYYHNEWSKVREYIEQRERDFARGLEDLNLSDELAVIESMYENVRKDIEANTPDSYISIGMIKNSSSVQPLPSLARHRDKRLIEAEGMATSEITRKAHDLGKRAQEAEYMTAEQVEKQVHNTEDKLTVLAEKAAEKVLEYTRRQSRSD